MMPEDDAMDLNDEGVRLAAEAIAGRILRSMNTSADLFVPADVTFRDEAEAAIRAYLRAVPESDELVRLRYATACATDFLAWARRFRAGDPSLDPEEWYVESESLANALAALSPDEAAGDSPEDSFWAGRP